MIKEKRKRKRMILIVCLIILLIVVLSLTILYFHGKNEYSAKYQNIVDEFVKDYYPGLSNRKIIVIEWDLFNGGSAFVPPLPFFSIIGVSTKVRNYSDDSIHGLFAHELAHLDNNRNESVFYFVEWLFSKKVRASYETDADQKAIQVGLGQYLLASAETDATLYSPEELEKRYTVDGYLSPEQIQEEIENKTSASS